MVKYSKLTKPDIKLLMDISLRFHVLMGLENNSEDGFDMDLAAIHVTTPLRLHDLLNADTSVFVYDITKMVSNLDRTTGKTGDYVSRFVQVPMSKSTGKTKIFTKIHLDSNNNIVAYVKYGEWRVNFRLADYLGDGKWRRTDTPLTNEYANGINIIIDKYSKKVGRS